MRGQSANGFAGLFVGRVRVTGHLQKAGGGFTVDHPTDPANKYLSHSFVESPEMLNVYSGTVTTNRAGVARVRLPAYFEALNRDFRYQLTVIGTFARAMVSEEIKGNEFAIRTDPGRVKVCWQVTGVRKDAWAEANRLPVEETKPKAERGRYLHPELFGKKAGAVHPAPAPACPTRCRRSCAVRPRKRYPVWPMAVRPARICACSSTRPNGRSAKQAAAARSRFEKQWRAVEKDLEAMPATRPLCAKRKR